jgi:hypothetical protein
VPDDAEAEEEDDESTLLEEEALVQEERRRRKRGVAAFAAVHAAEIAALWAEGAMPLDELLEKYRCDGYEVPQCTAAAGAGPPRVAAARVAARVSAARQLPLAG